MGLGNGGSCQRGWWLGWDLDCESGVRVQCGVQANCADWIGSDEHIPPNGGGDCKGLWNDFGGAV